MRNAAVAAGLGAALFGCGSGHSGAEAAKSVTHVTRKAPANPADTLSRNMVAAATQIKAGSDPLPVQVKFELAARPEVAQPLDIAIAIVPTSENLERVFGKVEGEEGLEVVGSGELPVAEKPGDGVPIQHSVKVLAKKDGIYALTATITVVDSVGQASSQAYLIPIIAGQGFPDLPTKAATPAAQAAAAKAAPGTAAH